MTYLSSRTQALLAAGAWAAAAILIGAAALVAPAAWAWIVATYFGAMAIMVTLNGLYRPARLRLDAEGLHFAHWRYVWSMRWAELAEVQLHTLRLNGFPFRRTVVLLDRTGAKRTISPGLTIAPRALVTLIRERHCR